METNQENKQEKKSANAEAKQTELAINPKDQQMKVLIFSAQKQFEAVNNDMNRYYSTVNMNLQSGKQNALANIYGQQVGLANQTAQGWSNWGSSMGNLATSLGSMLATPTTVAGSAAPAASGLGSGVDPTKVNVPMASNGSGPVFNPVFK